MGIETGLKRTWFILSAGWLTLWIGVFAWADSLDLYSFAVIVGVPVLIGLGLCCFAIWLTRLRRRRRSTNI
jgi:hypothetical protein